MKPEFSAVGADFEEWPVLPGGYKPPDWVGANPKAAIRRAARYDGWAPTGGFARASRTTSLETKLSSESITGVNVAGAMELPHEVQDRCGGLGGPPKPGCVSGGQHHQLPARDEVARCPGDRTTAERVLFAPYHQRGHGQLVQLLASYL